MANYTPISDFEVKDGLAHLDPEKIVSGAEIQAELDAIAAAIASKAGTAFEFINAVQTEEVAQIISDMLFAEGMIVPWYGSTLDIPSGWALCNGTNGTPDLRDRFIIGAGGSYNLNATGGATTDTATTTGGGSGETGEHVLTVDEIPSHEHGIPSEARFVDTAGTSDGIDGGAQAGHRNDTDFFVGPTGGDQGHSHTLDDHTHSVTVDTVPPYYGLYYIMYTGFDTDAGIGNTDEPLPLGQPVVLQMACSNLVDDLVSGTNVAYVRAPRGFTVTAVRASLLTASSSGSVTVDVNVNGSTILSTKLTIDVNEKTSVSAATAVVISAPTVADDDQITVDIDNAGADATGLIITIIGTSS